MPEAKIEELISEFEELYQIEKKARDLYNEFLKDSKTLHVIEVVTHIRDDEIKHMDIAQKIIEIIKKNK